MEEKKHRGTISIKNLMLFLVVFILGLVTNQIISQVLSGEVTTFTTLDLINFVVTILLSAASIVLAVTSILLGKTAEEELNRKTTESIRLQNEVFMRTNEVLNRIESSTGVTEKRIEDIISGRVGDISSRIAHIATSRSNKSKKEIENEVKQSIVSGLKKDNEKTEEERAIEKIEKERVERYKNFHQLILRAFANRDDTYVIKTLHGSFQSESEGLFDGVYKVGDKIIGVSAMLIELERPETISEYIMKIAKEIINGETSQVYLFLYDAKEEAFTEYYKKELEILKGNPSERIHFYSSNCDQVESLISKLEIAKV